MDTRWPYWIGCEVLVQDQERSGSSAHGGPGWPRVLLSPATLPQGADWWRHSGTSTGSPNRIESECLTWVE